MKKAGVLSGVMHAALFALVLLAPGPRRFVWDRAEAIAVDLVAPPAPPEPRPRKPAAEARPQAAPRAHPVEEATATPPPPAPSRRRKPPRVLRPLARPAREEGPTLAERLRSRWEEGVRPDAPAPVPAREGREPSPPEPTASSSAEVEAADFPYAWYLNVLRQRITEAWDPPADRLIAGRANRVLVRLRIRRDGALEVMGIEGGAGAPGLEASARRAVERVRPFRPLPEGFERDFLDVGVRFTVSGVQP